MMFLQKLKEKNNSHESYSMVYTAPVHVLGCVVLRVEMVY